MVTDHKIRVGGDHEDEDTDACAWHGIINQKKNVNFVLIIY